MTRLTNDLALDDREIHERFVRATGPGGQNLKKEATAVELRIDLTKSSLPADVAERLVALAGRHVTKHGTLVVFSRAFRSQKENRDAARARLISLLKRAARPSTKRQTTKPAPNASEERLHSKHMKGAVKRLRSVRDETGAGSWVRASSSR